jgi:hypothetical protein
MRYSGSARALSLVVSGAYEIKDDCTGCAYLLSKYEAATFEQARIHNELDLAERLRIPTQSLKLEAYEVTARRNSARAAFQQHHQTAHLAAEMRGVGSPSIADPKHA